MDRGTPSAETPHQGDFAVGHCSGQDACESSQTEGGKVLELGRDFIKTVRHYWPRLNEQLNRLPDTRFRPFVRYDKKFLSWWGLLLFSLKLGSRRQLDFELRDRQLPVLGNANRLAGTDQNSLPVHKTLNHFLGHVGPEAFAQLRTWCVRRLIRTKALDAFRLSGRFVVAVDGTGFLVFRRRHCEKCLTHRCDNTTLYLHPVLEAKLVSPCGLALSVGTEFIENPAAEVSSTQPQPLQTTTLSAYEKVKQDCELKAFARLAPALKRDFPQTPLCIGGDALFACGPVLDICELYHWSFVLTFKPGRTPDLWHDFLGLLQLAPQNSLKNQLPNGTLQHYRWVNDMCYIDRRGHSHCFDAILLEETSQAKTTTFSWITDSHVTHNNVAAIAEKGGRVRSKIENQGFNTQKNSGLNLEHAYSLDPDNIKAFYYLLQIAHIFLQLFEMGSLLKHLARRYQTTPIKLFGSLKNIARRLLDSLRYFRIPDDAFDPLKTARCQIRLNTS